MSAPEHGLTPALAAAYYVRAHWSQQAIAAKFSVSQMTVSRYLRRAGIDCRAHRAVAGLTEPEKEDRRRRRIPPALAARIRALVAAGASVRAVAAAIDRAPTTAWKWMRALQEEAAA